MANMFDYLRQQNLFGSPNIAVPQNPTLPDAGFMPAPDTSGPALFQPTIQPVNTQPVDQPMDIQPQTDTHVMRDRLNELISNYPERSNPSILRRIGAAIAGLGNRPDRAQAQDNILYGNFNNQLQDWGNKLGATTQAANIERYGNTNDRMAENQRNMDKFRQQQLDQQRARDEAKAENDRARNEAYVFKTTHPNFMYKVRPEDGHLIATNPLTNEQVDLKQWQWSEADKYNLLQRQALERISTTGANARATKSTPSAASSNKGLLPTQQKVARYLAAQRLVTDHPEWKDFFKFGDPGTNDVEITPPSEPGLLHMPGASDQYQSDMAVYKQITGALNQAESESQPASKSNSQPGSGPVSKPASKSKIPPGYKPKLDANGKQIGWTWGG